MIRRRRETDPRVTSLLEGHERERLLGWGELVDGTVVACTDWAIYLPETGRIPWDAIVRGEWSEEFLDLLVQLRPGQKATHMRLRFEEPGLVPAVVRDHNYLYAVAVAAETAFRHAVVLLPRQVETTEEKPMSFPPTVIVTSSVCGPSAGTWSRSTSSIVAPSTAW